MRSEASLDHAPASTEHPVSGAIGPFTGAIRADLAGLDWSPDLQDGEPTGRVKARGPRRSRTFPGLGWHTPGRLGLGLLALATAVGVAGGALGWYLAPASVETLTSSPSGVVMPPGGANGGGAMVSGGGAVGSATSTDVTPSGATDLSAGTAGDDPGAGDPAADSGTDPASDDPGSDPSGDPSSDPGSDSGSVQVQSPDPASAGQASVTPYVIDLTHWSLTVPVDGSKGNALMVASARTVSPWLSRNSDGSLSFWAPVNGSTTRTSSYPRTELRETMVPGDNSKNWTSRDPATLTATLAVSQIPTSTGKIIVGQIHGYNVKKSNIGPLLMLYYVRGNLVVAVRNGPTGKSQVKATVARGIPLGAQFSYRIRVAGNVVFLDVNGRQVFATPIRSGWGGVGLYFKAGVYVQATGSSSSDGGRTVFYALTAQH